MTEIDEETKRKAQEEGIPKTVPMVITERQADGSEKYFNFETREFEYRDNEEPLNLLSRNPPILTGDGKEAEYKQEEEEMKTSIAINRAMDKFFEKHGLKDGTLNEQIDKKALFLMERYPKLYTETIILEKIDEMLEMTIWNKGVADLEKVVKGNQTENIANEYLKQMLLATFRPEPEPEPKPRKINGNNILSSRILEAFEFLLYVQNPQVYKIYQSFAKFGKEFNQARKKQQQEERLKSVIEDVLGKRTIR